MLILFEFTGDNSPSIGGCTRGEQAVRNVYGGVFKHGIMMVLMLTAVTVQAEY